MDAFSINNKLKDLYNKWLNKDLATKYDIKEYTYPVLMKCNSEYCNSQTKILFITQEKKNWFSGNDGYQKPSKFRAMYNIDALMDWYDKFNEKITKKVSSTDYFEKIMVKTTKEINSKFDCLWTSVSKIERESQNYPDRKELHYCEDINLNILIQEIEFVNPDVIVFATGISNNNDISTIKKIIGNDSLFIPIQGNNKMSLVTKRDIKQFVVRIPNSALYANLAYNTLSTLIKTNANAYKYQTVEFQNSQINRYQYI